MVDVGVDIDKEDMCVTRPMPRNSESKARILGQAVEQVWGIFLGRGRKNLTILGAASKMEGIAFRPYLWEDPNHLEDQYGVLFLSRAFTYLEELSDA